MPGGGELGYSLLEKHRLTSQVTHTFCLASQVSCTVNICLLMD